MQLFTLATSAQFYDRLWMIGSYPTIKMKFSGNSTSMVTITPDILYETGGLSNISDTAGSLLFYCNGNQIGDSATHLMQGGDDLLDPVLDSLYPNGFVEPQTNIILPRSDNTFYVFYMSESDSLSATPLEEPDRLYYAIVDMDRNNGLGQVISKKNVAYKGLFGQCRLTACRHANGRDWWLVHQGFQNDEYFIYLVTPDSVYAPLIQHIGPSTFFNDNVAGASVFSPDGRKFATSTARGPLVIMDFNRCTGLFSDPDSINILYATFYYNGQIKGGLRGASGCSFSPNGRFLYTTNGISITQYDTWSSDVGNSAIKVGQWDTVGPVGGYKAFYQLYLLPDGRIIILNFAGGSGAFHLIDSPDIGGIGCHFSFESLVTNTNNATALPNMINYRLGALAGSGCDTLTAIKDITSMIGIKVYPNPAEDRITISLSQYHSNARLSISDAMGREVYRDDYMYLDKEINISGFASGIYQISIASSDGTAAMRFVKE